ncbi:MAG: outer membrane protein assembly factor BamD [Candidatus Omnitrophota bacterium]|nr:outer membrane protein assembly factor BamD [Candidatus Omnitrophota bacterium]
MLKKYLLVLVFIPVLLLCLEVPSHAFWLWSPKDKMPVNPKYAAKDTPREQFDWAMRFYKEKDFKRAAEEFVRLTKSYPDSDLAPDAQYYAGRSYEEQGKYLFAYENYQKTVEKYPYTRRMEEILKREYNIANIFENKDTAKFMDLELSLSLDRAATIYGKIVENSPFSTWAVKSLYKMAEVYRRMRKYSEAIDAYEKLIKDYPECDFVDEAKYQLAYARYEASLAPEYDQEGTEQALKEFKQLSRTTPVPSIAKEAEKALVELKVKKAESIEKIAMFYERQRKYRSAILYYKDISRNYPKTEVAKRAEEKIEILQQRIKD